MHTRLRFVLLPVDDPWQTAGRGYHVASSKRIPRPAFDKKSTWIDCRYANFDSIDLDVLRWRNATGALRARIGKLWGAKLFGNPRLHQSRATITGVQYKLSITQIEPGTDSFVPHSEQELLSHFRKLWSEADQLWEERQNQPAWHSYVSADYQAVFETLSSVKGLYSNFLEWGSGLGVVTMMASRLGFEAYGIEAEGKLIEHSEEFAAIYAPDAVFAEGSFIPEEYEWDPENGGDVYRSSIGAADAYDQLGMEISDFDLIYAYPWPDEHPLLHAIIRQFGRPDTTLITYDACEGVAMIRVNEEGAR